MSGLSGVGKGTLITRLLGQHPNGFVTTISHTTRKPRAGELESGNNTYHFVNFAEFQSLIDQNAFVEHTFFSGNHYGTSWQTILDQQGKGKILIFDIDINGVKNIRDTSKSFAVRCAFIAPPSVPEGFETVFTPAARSTTVPHTSGATGCLSLLRCPVRRLPPRWRYHSRRRTEETFPSL